MITQSSFLSECWGNHFFWSNGKKTSDGSGILGQDLISPNCKYQLLLQTDGNIVLKKRDSQLNYSIILWSRGQCCLGTPPYELKMQKDNNLVLYDSQGSSLWATNTDGQGPNKGKAELHDNGNFVVHDGEGTELWSTNTKGG